MPQRAKEDKRQNAEGRVLQKKNWGGMPERVKKTKYRGVAKKIEGGGYAGLRRGEKTKCGEVIFLFMFFFVFFWGGGGVGGARSHKKSRRSVENYVFFRGGGHILNEIAQYDPWPKPTYLLYLA